MESEIFKERKNAEHPGFLVNIDEDDINITHSLRQAFFSKFFDMVDRFEIFLTEGELKIVLNNLGPSIDRYNPYNQLVQVDLHFWTKVKVFNSTYTGRGIIKIFTRALDTLETQIQKYIERAQG